jgi:hypothetical protein
MIAITGHARRQQADRKIGLDEIKETLRCPEKARESYDDCFVFIKHVDDRRIKVVFTFNDGGGIRVVTVGDETPRPAEMPGIAVSDAVLACAAGATRGDPSERELMRERIAADAGPPSLLGG